VEVANPIYDVVFKYLMEDERILRWLLMAATNARMRHDMNVEDEYFSIIEKQDTEILMKTRELAERTVELAEKDSQLAESKSQLAETSPSSRKQFRCYVRQVSLLRASPIA